MTDCPECRPSKLTVHGEKKLRAELDRLRTEYSELRKAAQAVVDAYVGRPFSGAAPPLAIAQVRALSMALESPVSGRQNDGR